MGTVLMLPKAKKREACECPSGFIVLFRLDLYIEATEYLNEQAPMAFWYDPAHIMVHIDNIERFWAGASGLYQITGCYIELIS